MMKTKVTFTLPAANIIGAEECVLLGEFNNWNLEEGHYLKKQADGSMQVEVELETGNDYQYRYLLGNGRWVNDDNEKIISEMSGFPVENCIIRLATVTLDTIAEKPKAVKPKIKSAAFKNIFARFSQLIAAHLSFTLRAAFIALFTCFASPT